MLILVHKYGHRNSLVCHKPKKRLLHKYVWKLNQDANIVPEVLVGINLGT